MKPHALTEDRRAFREKIARLYRLGFTLKDIAEEIGCTAPTIHYHLRRMGVKMRTANESRKNSFNEPVDETV